MSTFDLTGIFIKNVKQSTASDHQLECDCLVEIGRFHILASNVNKY